MAATNKKMIDYHVMEYIWHDRRNNAQMRDHHMRQAVVVYAYCTRKQFEKFVAKAQQVTAWHATTAATRRQQPQAVATSATIAKRHTINESLSR